jgi:hypothetical protein
MRIPIRPPDAARLARAQTELARVEARLRQDALKAEVIARIVNDTAKNKDVLDRPAMFAALTQDPDSMIELARQAGWLAEESPATGTELRRAGTLLGSLLNAFQIPSERTEAAPIRQAQSDEFVRSALEGQRQGEPVSGLGATIGSPQLPSAMLTNEASRTIMVPVAPQQKPVAIDQAKGIGLPAPLVSPICSLRTARPVFIVTLALLGVGLLVWFYL